MKASMQTAGKKDGEVAGLEGISPSRQLGFCRRRCRRRSRSSSSSHPKAHGDLGTKRNSPAGDTHTGSF